MVSIDIIRSIGTLFVKNKEFSGMSIQKHQGF
jgi:hypothetical protein